MKFPIVSLGGGARQQKKVQLEQALRAGHEVMSRSRTPALVDELEEILGRQVISF